MFASQLHEVQFRSAVEDCPVLHKVPVTTVLSDQVHAVERWLVADGDVVTSGQSVVEIVLIQLVENDWMRSMLSEVEDPSMAKPSYPCSICSLQLEAQVGGVIRHLKAAGERVECGEPLFEIRNLAD